MSVYTTNSNRLPDGSTADAAGDGPSDEQARLEEAMRKADEKKQFAKAAELYEQIAKENPADAEIRQKLDLAKSQASKAR